MPYRNNRTPDSAWRVQYQGGTFRPVKQLPAWSREDVQFLLDNPSTITPDAVEDTLDALLDNRQPLESEAEALRTALYEVLKARRRLEGSSRLKAMQRLEGCTCGRIDYTTDEHGTRRCGCGRSWKLRIEVRHTVFQVKDRAGTQSVPMRLPVARGRHLVVKEI